jgi:hypothetical protein
MMPNTQLKEGYWIFISEAAEEKGMPKCLRTLRDMIRDAEKDFDITFLGGARVDDEPGASKNSFLAYQTVVLKGK